MTSGSSSTSTAPAGSRSSRSTSTPLLNPTSTWVTPGATRRSGPRGDAGILFLLFNLEHVSLSELQHPAPDPGLVADAEIDAARGGRVAHPVAHHVTHLLVHVHPHHGRDRCQVRHRAQADDPARLDGQQVVDEQTLAFGQADFGLKPEGRLQEGSPDVDAVLQPDAVRDATAGRPARDLAGEQAVWSLEELHVGHARLQPEGANRRSVEVQYLGPVGMFGWKGV